jgi:hypothetical protein
MKVMTDSLSRIYSRIVNNRQKYAELKKCEIHLHTPASYDYCLIERRNYESLTIEELIEYSFQVGYLNKAQKETILLEINKPSGNMSSAKK